MKTEIFMAIAKCAMTVLGIVITGYVIPFIKSVIKPYIEAKIGEIEGKKLIAFIEDAVEWANQTIPKDECERRKAEVMDKVLRFMNTNLAIELTVEDIDTLIEAFVKKCKKE